MAIKHKGGFKFEARSAAAAGGKAKSGNWFDQHKGATFQGAGIAKALSNPRLLKSGAGAGEGYGARFAAAKTREERVGAYKSFNPFGRGESGEDMKAFEERRAMVEKAQEDNVLDSELNVISTNDTRRELGTKSGTRGYDYDTLYNNRTSREGRLSAFLTGADHRDEMSGSQRERYDTQARAVSSARGKGLLDSDYNFTGGNQARMPTGGMGQSLAKQYPKMAAARNSMGVGRGPSPVEGLSGDSFFRRPGKFNINSASYGSGVLDEDENGNRFNDSFGRRLHSAEGGGGGGWGDEEVSRRKPHEIAREMLDDMKTYGMFGSARISKARAASKTGAAAKAAKAGAAAKAAKGWGWEEAARLGRLDKVRIIQKTLPYIKRFARPTIQLASHFAHSPIPITVAALTGTGIGYGASKAFQAAAPETHTAMGESMLWWRDLAKGRLKETEEMNSEAETSKPLYIRSPKTGKDILVPPYNAKVRAASENSKRRTAFQKAHPYDTELATRWAAGLEKLSPEEIKRRLQLFADAHGTLPKGIPRDYFKDIDFNSYGKGGK